MEGMERLRKAVVRRVMVGNSFIVGWGGLFPGYQRRILIALAQRSIAGLALANIKDGKDINKQEKY